jgi:hypothetical protein
MHHMTTKPDGTDWPDDWHERIEAKIDAYRDEHYKAQSKSDGRLTRLETEWALFKRILAFLPLGIPAAWSAIKSKFGNQ